MMKKQNKILVPTIVKARKKKEYFEVMSAENFQSISDELAKMDNDFLHIIDIHGYSPRWTRPNTFETMVHFILEQQVSLASALAALKKLQEKTKGITPETILALNDEEMRAAYVSRQKMAYIRGLATALHNKTLDLQALENLSNDDIRSELIKLKGIGNWTVDVYLLFVLQRADVLPIGDLGIVNAIKKIKGLPKETTREELLKIAENWKPYRSVATFLLWHYYLSNVGSKALLKQIGKRKKGTESAPV